MDGGPLPEEGEGLLRLDGPRGACPIPTFGLSQLIQCGRGADAFLSKFKGKCFRCLSKLHRRKDWRDPPHCIIYE